MPDGVRVIASIEARMASSRLPGKMLADLGDVTVVALIIRRVRKAAGLDGVVLATTDSRADDELAAAAAAEGVSVYRGSEDDVLDRVVRAHQMMDSDIIVKLCGDCPLIDPAIIERAVATYREGGCDLVTTTAPQSYPQGMDVEVFSRSALEEVAATVYDPAVREHVSLYFYEHPERYRIVNLEAPPDLADPEQRLQLDYAEDLQVLRTVHRALSSVCGDDYGLPEIRAWLDANASVRAINSNCAERAPR